jgi:site-specific DNA-methyltransferase (adenine-specific)/modification methylase
MAEKVVIGNAELWHGDCREVLPLLPVFDLVLTDPPYGISFAAQPTLWQRKAGKEPEDWDNATPPAWLFGLMREKGRHAIVWGGNYYELPISRGWLSWKKPDAPPSMAHFELAWTSFDMNGKQLECSISSTNAERVGHPTQKRLRVMIWSLSFAPDAQTVCDPFMGSGTTGVACAQLGKAFTGIERERKYFDIACRRIEEAQKQGQMFEPESAALAVQQGLL